MATRKEITDAIFIACKSIVPQAHWSFIFNGANKSNDYEGTLVCDRIEFLNTAKGIVHATAKFVINLVDYQNTQDIDSHADELFQTFNQNNFGGLCYNAEIKRIIYGAPINMPNASLCRIELDVEFPFEVRKE